MKNTVPSASRTAAFGKYLVALSSSLGNLGEKNVPNWSNRSGSSVRRRQVHILYLLNDLLHHAKYHLGHDSVYSTFTTNIQSYLITLAGIASAYDTVQFRNHLKKIDELLQIWSERQYFHPLYLQKLRDIVGESQETAHSEKAVLSQRKTGEPSREPKTNAPYIMPHTHGELTTPFYDLPAGNMIPHIIPNSSIPINPQVMKPVQLTAGPAQESLINVLKRFMEDVDPNNSTKNEDETAVEIDELGNIVYRDTTTGESLGSDGYYGWSRVLCERMKRNRDGIESSIDCMKGDGNAYRSLSPRKRRRYSYPENRGDWERGRSRSTTGSASDSAVYRRSSRNTARRGRNSRSRSEENSLPREPEYRKSRARSRSISIFTSRSNSYSPPRHVVEPQQRQATTRLPQLPLPSSTPISTPIPPSSFSQASNQGFPSGHGIHSLTPPRPPNYQGPWPPPPPPLPYHSTNIASDGRSYAQFPLFGLQSPPPYGHASQSKQPIYATWSQHQHQPQPDRAGNHPYPNPASSQPSLSGPRVDRGSWG